MSSQSGLIGIYCPQCDRTNSPPSLLQRQMASKQEGMLMRCPACNRTYAYAALLALKPRMLQPEFVEKPPQGTVTIAVPIYPEVLEALKQKFPHNLITTLCALLTSVADPETVVIEGEHAREIAALGIRRGREVLALAKEVVDLRQQLAESKLREKILEPILRALGGVATAPPSADPATSVFPQPAPGPIPPPPQAQFAQLREDPAGTGLLVPADGSLSNLPAAPFSFAPGPAAPIPSATPGFVTRNLRYPSST